MPKTKISEYSVTNSSNTDIEGINIDEGCAPSGINNAIRELMVHLKEFQTGASGDAFTFAGGVLISGTTNTITGNVLMSGTNTITGSTTATFAAGAVGTPSIAAHGDTNTGIFFPAADTIAFAEGGAEAMRIDSSGDVAIGTTTGSIFSTSGINLSVSNASGLATVAIAGSSGNSGYLELGQGSVRGALIEGSTNAMIFYTNGTGTGTSVSERMRINSSGQVGIGTNNPTDRLTVSDGTTNVAVNPTGGVFYFGPTTNHPTIFITNNSERARITGGGYFKASNNGSYLSSGAAYHEIVSNDASEPGTIVQTTNASQTGDTLQLRATRNTTNNTFYFFGCYNNTASAYKLRVADSGNVTNTNGSYGTISDLKLKQDIVDAGSQWDDIKNLRFRKYRLKSEVELDPNAKPFLGLVAQEAELVSPGLIEEHRDTKQETKTREVEKTREIPAVLDEDGNEVEPARIETYTETEEYTETVDLGTTTKSIKTSILYMKAVKALQEAMTRIEALEAQNASFEARLAALEAN